MEPENNLVLVKNMGYGRHHVISVIFWVVLGGFS